MMLIITLKFKMQDDSGHETHTNILIQQLQQQGNCALTSCDLRRFFSFTSKQWICGTISRCAATPDSNYKI
jgi:hypothetical protein